MKKVTITGPFATPDDVARLHGITEERRAELDSILIGGNKCLVARLWYDSFAPEERRCINENVSSGIVGCGATFEAAIQDMRDKTPPNLPLEDPKLPATAWQLNYGTKRSE